MPSDADVAGLRTLPGVPPDPLDRTSAVPLHAQVAAALRAEIRGHELPPGRTLPSEKALMARFGVARSVVRQALSGLAEEDLVRRERGRGAVVTPAAEQRRLTQRATGLFAQFARNGIHLQTRVTALTTAAPPPDIRVFLETDQAIRLERVRSSAEGPLAYVRTWLPRAAVPGLTADVLRDTSLHQHLARRYGLELVRGRRRIQAVAADRDLADALLLAPGAPLLLLDGDSRDQHGRPLERVFTWHRAEQVVLDIDITAETEEVRLGPSDELLAHARPDPTGTDGPTSTAIDTGDEGALLARAAELAHELDVTLAALRERG